MNDSPQSSLSELLDGKNPEQQDGIKSLNGPTMIVAGAGSGKTTVLINRTANMLINGINPSNIMIITFTNKAASELKDRLREKVGEKADYVMVGTFHSTFKDTILKQFKDHQFWKEYGIDLNQFNILDSKDSDKLYKEAFDMLPVNVRQFVEDGQHTLSHLTSSIAEKRAVGMDYDDYFKQIAPSDSDFTFKQSVFFLWRNYKNLCIEQDGMDFDEILVSCNKFLASDPKVSISLASKYKYIMIDEYQDTNGVQMSITDAIAQHHNNICVVGDEKQSIYAFRGSDIKIILGFEQRYLDTKKISMHRNYRSQSNIISVSNAVANAMKERLTDGQLTPMNELQPSPVKLVQFTNTYSEAENIVKSVQKDLSKGVSGKNIAIIYRNKILKNEIEKQLVSKKVPYTLIGDTSFFQRSEVKDAIAMVRFLFRHWDSMAGLRVLSATNFGISDKAARTAMRDNKKPVYQYLVDKSVSTRGNGQPTAAARKATVFLNVLNNVKAAQELGCRSKDLKEYLSDAWDIFLKPKMSNQAKKSANKEAASNLDGKIENVKQLFEQFCDSYDSSYNIDKVIDDLTLMVEQTPEMDRERHAKIQLMTIHASKGLEFKNVYIIGVDSATLPGGDIEKMSASDIEESRRLLYVAMTRAEDKLTMTYSKVRFQYGEAINTEMSPFLSEININKLPIEHILADNTSTSYNRSY
jgi:DNA helicase-2/ATP-dependent DNA helicase PcrA